MTRKDIHEGSVIIITLVFVAILMATVVGISFLLAKLLGSGTLVVDGIQAGYNAESGLEVGLYELKVRREGYEQKRTMDIGGTSSSYEIAYSSKPLQEITHTFDNSSSDTLTLALFRDMGNKIVDINEAPYDIQFLFKQAQATTGACANIRLIGLKGDTYESISKSYPCSIGNTPQSIKGDVDTTVRIIGSDKNTLGFDDFIKTHTEIKVEIKDLKQTPSNPLQVTLRHGQNGSSKEIASKMSLLTATGTSGKVTIKKSTENTQSQILRLLTNSFSITK